MSQAWLRPAGEPDYLELRLKDLRRPAVTLWEWQLAGKRLRAQGRREVDEEAQFEAVEANRLLVADAQTKTSRRQAQRRAAARKEFCEHRRWRICIGRYGIWTRLQQAAQALRR